MKKIQLSLLVLVLVIFAACKKEVAPVSTQTAKYVKAIQGSFIAKDGDITFKSSPVGVNRTWTMYARNSSFYGNQAFALVKGKEFITGSAAQIWWANDVNNPVTFPEVTSVYSNLTPDEDLRLITETKVAGDAVAYLGILDFNPDHASFPLTINCFRLGDTLKINTDAITKLPGGTNLTITAKFNLAPIDLAATKLGPVTGTGGVPNGLQFRWEDIIYGTPVLTTVTAGSGDFVLYGGLDSKVLGTVDIIITETGNGGSTITKHATLSGPGKGTLLKLTTDRVGWYDSGTINFSDKDISVEVVNVPID